MRGNITRRGRASWRFKFDLDRGADGKRETRYVTLKGTRAQAEAEAARIMASISSGEHVQASGESVAQFADRWLRDWAAINVSAKTFTRYEQLLRVHLLGHCGRKPIQKLTAADLQAAYAAMAAKGLAPRTRLHLHRVAHRMLKHAVKWGTAARNVASMVDAPRVRAREIEILNAEQLRGMLTAIEPTPLHPIAALALGSGARLGEVLALRWQDIDLASGVLRIERAIEHTKRGGLVFKEPKSKRSRRTVTLPASTITVMRGHWKTQQEHRLALGRGKAGGDALVFAGIDGGPLLPATISKYWARTMRRLGLRVNFHSLRHAHASALISAGLDVLTISRRLGHGSASLTLGTYGHLFKPDDRAASAMEAALTGMPT
jgi:integrase